MRTNLLKITILFAALFSYQCTHEPISFNDSYLGENIVKLNYADIPFDEKGMQIEKFILRKFSTGRVEFSLVPIQVQF